MKNMLMKDTYIEIKKSLGRFLSIFAIIALGVAFFAGIKVAPEFMKTSLDTYYDEQNFMDFSILSTLGITEDDIEAVKKVEGVKEVTPVKTMDLIGSYEDKDFVFKAIGINNRVFNGKDEGYVNKPLLLEGRYPQNPNECLVEYDDLKAIPIGTKIIASSGNENDINEGLENIEYTVVGYAQTPYYLSFEKGKANIGTGEVSNFLMIDDKNFKSDIYTEAFVTVEGVREKNTFEDEYFKEVDKVIKKVEDLSINRIEVRYDSIIEEANKKLLESEKTFLEEKEKALTEFKKVENELINSKNLLINGQKELVKQKADFESKIKNGEKELALAKEKIIKSKEDIKKLEEAIKASEEGIEALTKGIEESKGQLNTLIKGNEQIDEQLKDEGLSEEARRALELKKQENNILIGQLNEGIKVMEGELTTLKKTRDDLIQKEAYGKGEIAKGEERIVTEEALLKESKPIAYGEFEKAQKEIDNGYKKLADGEKEFKDSKLEVEDKLKDGEREIQKAKNEIGAIEKPSWFVLDREKNYSYMNYKSSADSISSIAQVFPIFFFLVAALVCLTTMTRMVDEQRVTMGTLKALGYSKFAIASKYLFYAAFASICGSLVGLTIGMNLFPAVIFNAYGMMFNVPKLIKEFNIYYSTIAILAAVSITTLAAYFACKKELVDVPSTLMRPKAPPQGKRILLERIGFIWSRLNFISKVTARNIFRYKKRFFMTVIGISGCTALLLTGFGIKDSIETIVDKQFGELFKYNMVITVDKSTSSSELNDIKENLNNESDIKSFLEVNQSNVKVVSDVEDKDSALIVVEDKEVLNDFVTLRNRKTKEGISLSDNGVVISEKLAGDLNLKVGEEVTLKDEDDNVKSIKIDGLTENYTGAYIYMSSKLYNEIYGYEPEINSILTINNSIDKDFEINLNKKISDLEKVTAVNYNSGIKESFNDTIANLNVVVIVMILSAGALAFVVLYNLTNVNISERLREIATIKVLGFYNNEVGSYVFRENIILTIIGSLVGVLLGKGLHQFIIKTTEMDAFMFGRELDFTSILYAVGLTIVFGVVVSLVMYKKLKTIPMVESLKSVD